MNKQKFNSVITEPENITISDAKELSELAKSHPYSQIIHALVAKSYVGKDANHYKKSVAVAAMYAADRQVLKELVTPKTTKKPQLVKSQAPTSPPEKKIETKEKEPNIEAPNKRKVDIDISSFSSDSELLRNNIWSDLEDLKASKAHYLEFFEASEQTTKKERKEKSTPKTSTKKANEPTVAKQVKAQTKTDVKKEKPKKPSAKKSAVKKSTTKTASSEKKQATTSPKAKTTTAKKQSPKEKKSTPVKKKTESPKAESPTGPKASVKEQIKIIDSFINKEPSISSRSVTSVSGDQKDLSVKSTSFGDDLLSENLAQILIEQGKTQKAIDMYKKLIWKFPQKKTYFAARIEDLTK